MRTGHTVLLAGLPRSGTTWTAEALGRTRDAILVHEPDNDRLHLAAVAAKADLGRFPLLRPGDQARTYGALWRHAATGTATLSGRRNRWAAAQMAAVGDRGVDRVMAEDPGPWPRRLRAAVVASHIPAGGARPAAPVVIKSVHCVLAVEWVAAALAPVTVGVIVRHPANVIGSWRDMGWQAGGLPWNDPRLYSGRGLQGDPPGRPEPWIVRAAWRFALMADGLLAGADRGGWVEVDHGDLLADPPAQLAAVAEQLGLEWTDGAAGWVESSNRPGEGYALDRIADTERGRWRSRLEPDELDEVAAVLDRFPRLAGRWPLG